MSNNHYPFQLLPLPYAYNALEPYIDTKTMQLHHDKHLATYVNNLNAALKDYPQFQSWSLEQLLLSSQYLPESIRTAVAHNGGGVYNHDFFFANLAPESLTNQPSGKLLEAMNNNYGNLDTFKRVFKEDALAVFGSGYTWLSVDADGGFQLVNTANQETLLPLDLCPVIGIDVWEHAYYLKDYNVRSEYIDDWFKIINWPQAEQNYLKCFGAKGVTGQWQQS